MFTGLFVLCVPLSCWRILKTHSDLESLRQGRRGELVVGQALERLRADGYDVLHDIPGEGHNIDHVLIGPGGVFAIETKTWSKPKGDSRVVFDGKTVTAAGQAPDRGPVDQVLAARDELQRIIYDRTGLKVDVRPVILYPGWFTESSRQSEVWVLNENAFPQWVAKDASRLSDAEIHQISNGVARHVWDQS